MSYFKDIFHEFFYRSHHNNGKNESSIRYTFCTTTCHNNSIIPESLPSISPYIKTRPASPSSVHPSERKTKGERTFSLRWRERKKGCDTSVYYIPRLFIRNLALDRLPISRSSRRFSASVYCIIYYAIHETLFPCELYIYIYYGATSFWRTRAKQSSQRYTYMRGQLNEFFAWYVLLRATMYILCFVRWMAASFVCVCSGDGIKFVFASALLYIVEFIVISRLYSRRMLYIFKNFCYCIRNL